MAFCQPENTPWVDAGARGTADRSETPILDTDTLPSATVARHPSRPGPAGTWAT
jgi:hypothetical protein